MGLPAPISREVAIGVVGQILAGLDRAYTGFGEVVDGVTEGAERLRRQLADVTHFDFDPRFRTRVISVPRASESFDDLWAEIKDIFDGKAQRIVDDARNVVEQIQNLPPRAPGEPILQRTSVILQFIHATNHEIAELVQEILNFGTAIADIKERIRTLDDLFLPSGSTKTTVDVRYRKRNA